MKTTVINIRDAPKGWMHDPRYTYIGRAGAGFDGKWGNPIILRSEKARENVYEAYKLWLYKQPRKFLLEMVHDLEGQILVCFCKPKLCHGDAIVELIEKFWNQPEWDYYV